MPKQRPIPPKRPFKPRASTDAPVAAQRPVPTPRRTGAKEITKSSLKEVPDEIMNDKTNVLELPVTSNLNAESHEQEESHKDDTEIVASKMSENTEEERAETMLPENNGTANTDTDSKNSNNSEASAIPPSHINFPEEKTVFQESVSENHYPKAPNASNTDEYEHMKPGVTKDQSSSYKETVKSPEYEEPEEWNLESPKQLNSGGYATPSPVPKKDEAAYDMPVTPINLKLPPAPQVPILATVNEERLTAGRGKSPPLPRNSTGEDQLKPFQMERDALGVMEVSLNLVICVHSLYYILVHYIGKEQCI